MTKKRAAIVALTAAVILSFYVASRHISVTWHSATHASTLPTISQTGQKKIRVCPMHPEIMQDHPGTCPICGMNLVESKDSGMHDHGIHVDTATVQRLGVRLASVKRTTLGQEIRTYGNVVVDERTLYNVHSKFDGWIKKSYVHSVGQRVDQGQVIYEIYSPDLIMRQKEYLKFLARRTQILQTIGKVPLEESEYVMDLLREFAKERAKFVQENVSLESLDQIEDSKQAQEVVKIVAEKSGVVTQIVGREGSAVTLAAPVLTLADISRVWIDVVIYPDQIGRVRKGDAVTVKGPGGQSIEAELDFIYPIAESNKVRARISLDNTKYHLIPGAFVDVILHAQAHEALALPRSAVMYTGQGNMVMVSQGEGHFLPLHIETGVESGEWIEVVDGLTEGAEVAVNGQFLLDSAASIGAAAERMRIQKP